MGFDDEDQEKFTIKEEEKKNHSEKCKQEKKNSPKNAKNYFENFWKINRIE